MTEKEIAEIDEAARYLESDGKEKCLGNDAMFAARLRALLPQPETLVDVCTDMVRMWDQRPDWECRVEVDCKGAFCDRLRAALERERGKA